MVQILCHLLHLLGRRRSGKQPILMFQRQSRIPYELHLRARRDLSVACGDSCLFVASEDLERRRLKHRSMACAARNADQHVQDRITGSCTPKESESCCNVSH
jgi:hypothetical protein